MAVTSIEIAAYLGAAAWLPQIGVLLYKNFVNPLITIVPEKQVEIGYTTFGPILNLNLAVSNTKKESILDFVGLEIEHEDGAHHQLSWAGMKEILMEAKDSSGAQQALEREHKPIALSLSKNALTERFFRFQDMSFNSKLQELITIVKNKRAFLTKTKMEMHDDLLKTEEVHNLLEHFKTGCWWKSGKYTLKFKVSSPSSIALAKHSFSFQLDNHDIDLLSNNLKQFQIEVENEIKLGLEGFEKKPVNWLWVTPTLKKEQASNK